MDTEYHQKLSDKSQLRNGSIFSNKRNLAASLKFEGGNVRDIFQGNKSVQ